ncbi:26S proteasome regulatory subunit [Trichinella spiralis]|uniref:26S proteasome regulatory subunit n=1 Tax=Trichinella spiralis TaxID=6334 RepID=A0ABR3K4J4_TRISP
MEKLRERDKAAGSDAVFRRPIGAYTAMSKEVGNNFATNCSAGIPGRVTVNGHSATYAACTVPTVSRYIRKQKNTKMSLRPIFRAGILMPIFSSRFCSQLILGFSVHHGASLKAPTMSLDVY